ncbi:MAG TPA: hypothetical protein VFB74_00240 [Kribbellaceae bacterium]|jgi:hypothetical protein|nr:hypothetical protein [Kribbellaceae bacterium]
MNVSASNISVFAELLAVHDVRLLPGSYAVPVDVLAGLPDGSVAHFIARGTTIRLALYAPDALTSVVIATQCGCGQHHEPAGPRRMTIRADAIPLVVRAIDGRSAFGWTGHEAGMLRLSDAAPYFFDLLSRATDAEPAVVLAAV